MGNPIGRPAVVAAVRLGHQRATPRWKRSDAQSERHMNPAQAELSMYLASTAQVREAAQHEVGRLLGSVDTGAYAAVLAERGLLALLGSRAIELAPESVDELFRSRVCDAMRQARLRALALDTTLRRIVQALEDSGIPALPLKGTMLADRVHGDPGLRPTTDVDVLVPRAHIGAAVETLRALGYAAPEDPVWIQGLPELHYTFLDSGAVPIRAELHWRVHWSESGFSDELLGASAKAPDGLRRAEPAHELALLLLIFARDGLYGPRLVTDIAAWWDQLGDQLAPGALDGIVLRYPSLRRSLVAGLLCAERFVGVPASRVLTDAAADHSTRRAVAMADPFFADEHSDRFGTVMLIDALLSTGREKMGFLRRYYLQPLPYVRKTYGLGEAVTVVVAGRSALHFVGTLVKKSPRMIRAASRPPRRPMLQDVDARVRRSTEPRRLGAGSVIPVHDQLERV